MKNYSYRRFIILTAPRSGSNLLSYLLHSHTSIVSIGEPYCIETIWGRPAKEYMDQNFIFKVLRDTAPGIFLRIALFHRYPENIAAVGFRIFYHHLDHFVGVRDILKSDTAIRVIHLKRRNLLENYVSLVIAHKTNTWSSLSPAQDQVPRFTLSSKECKEYFQYIKRSDDLYSKMFHHHSCLTVYYEDLLYRQKDECDRMLKFLNVNRQELSCKLIKQNTRKPEDVIINYKDLKKGFLGTQWECLFA
jgi:LPS sulfotransferase NodH